MARAAGADDTNRVFEGDELAPAPTSANRPFLKWAGGKTRLLSRLLPFVPETFDRYFEPFLGGGAMFFAVRGRAMVGARLADLNDELTNSWLAVRDSPEELFVELEAMRSRDSKEYYLLQRSMVPAGPVARAARFVYLNQTSWNGLWRVNRWGQFNVPWGQREFRGLSLPALKGYSEALQHANIDSSDFRDVLEEPTKGDFVYLDPPYLPLSETSKFYLYTEKRFREPDLRDLAKCCDALSSRGVSWILSNRDTPLVRELFGNHHVIALTTKRSVAAQNRRSVEAVDSPEVIVVGNPE